MVFLGFGKYARADRIYALEPLTGDDRGDGRRTRVWIEGIAEPIIASRTERAISPRPGTPDAGGHALVDEAVALAEADRRRLGLGANRPCRSRPARPAPARVDGARRAIPTSSFEL